MELMDIGYYFDAKKKNKIQIENIDEKLELFDKIYNTSNGLFLCNE